MATYAHTVIAGTTDVYEHPIGFEYSRATDVKVYIDDVEIDHGSGAGKYLLSTAGTKIIFEDGSEPQTGEELAIKRVTDLSTAAVSFAAGGGATQSDLNAAVTQLRFAIDELQVPAFDSGWASLATLISGAVDIEHTHNLGAAPTRWEVQLKCTTNDSGYVVGDVIHVDSGDHGLPVMFTATTATIPYAAAEDLEIIDPTNGNSVAIDDNDWNYRVVAWR